MIWKSVTLACVVLGALAHEPAISEVHMRRHDEPVHRGHHGELGHIGHEQRHHEEYAWSYPSYEYAYKVHDPHTGDNHGHAELRKGDEVKGEYYLVEPDGNRRVVTYHADKTGFHAQVHNSAPHHHVYYKSHEPHHVPEHRPIHHEPLLVPHIPLVKHEPIRVHHEPIRVHHEPIRVHEPEHHRPAHYEERIVHHPHHQRVHHHEEHVPRVHHQSWGWNSHHEGHRRLYRDDKQQREQAEQTEQIEQENEA